MTLHTNAGASIASTSNPNGGKIQQKTFTGQILTSDCDVNAPDQSKNAGCAILDNNSSLTFGSDFNLNGGGVYATEWTSDFIKIWFFPRGSFPSDIASASPSPSENWGPPNSMFAGNFNMDDHFRNLKIIFDTTFCGDWAGNTWNQTSCANLAPTCEEYVTKNPSAFTEAYWAVNTLQVFQDDGVGNADNRTSIVGKVDNEPEATIGPGTRAANGRFIQNAAVSHLNLDAQEASLPKGKWLQSRERRLPRRRAGGAVLPKRT